MIVNLKLGGIEIPFDAAHGIEQDYSPIEASTILRMSNGTAIKQTAWSGKTRIMTRGGGKIPLPLLGLDYSGALTMQCCTPLLAYGASNAVTVPANRRSDVSMIGQALVNGRLVHAPIASVAGNVVTLTSISGAAHYQVSYWPTFSVLAKRPSETGSGRSLPRSWSLEAEEV